MRAEDDVTYKEYKEGLLDWFELLGEEGWETPQKVSKGMFGDDDEVGLIVGTSKLLWFLSVCEYEIRNDILEDWILVNTAYHIHKYEENDDYKNDLELEEIKEIEEDIAYVRKNVELPTLDDICKNKKDMIVVGMFENI